MSRCRWVPHERGQQRNVNVPLAQLLEEPVDVRLAPHERVQQRTAEKIVDVPQYVEVIVEGGEVGPTRTSATADCRAKCGCSSSSGAQIVDLPRFRKETVGVVRLVPREQVQRIDE